MKNLITLGLLLGSSLYLCGQNLVLRDKEGNQVNNDTIEVVFYPTQNHGWTEITSEIYIENTSNDTLEVGFRKVQYNPIKEQEYHSFCFAGFCVDSSTYIAPFPTYILPGKIDSSFSGHYRFDDLLHEPGTYLVSYHFYNVNDSLDTAMVYVMYNTLNQLDIVENTNDLYVTKVFPNPAVEEISVSYRLPHTDKNYLLLVTNFSGQCIYKQILPQESEIARINTREWASGIYFYSIVKENVCIIAKKFIVGK